MRSTDLHAPNSIPAPEVNFRIPGTWSGIEEFLERLPSDCHLTRQGFLVVDGFEYELNALPADDQFPRIFASSCPKLPTEDECEQIEGYNVNVCLTGRGGSIDAAERLMTAAGAVLRAGGAGVFIDNCGLAHGATDWFKLLNSAADGGVYWAFVTAVRGETKIYSMGMHVLGCRDAIVPATGNDEFDHRALHSFLGFSAFSGANLVDGDAVGDPVLPTFRIHTQPDDRFPNDAPMHNPYGRWRLEPLEVAQNTPSISEPGCSELAVASRAVPGPDYFTP